jgi:hypothetical protein
MSTLAPRPCAAIRSALAAAFAAALAWLLLAPTPAHAQFTLRPSSDLSVTLTANPNPVSALDPFDLTAQVRNTGLRRFTCQRDPLRGFVCTEVNQGLDSTATSLTFRLPFGYGFDGFSAEGGFICRVTANDAGNGLVIGCDNGLVRNDGTAQVRLRLRAPGSAAAHTLNAQVAGNVLESSTSNNLASLAFTVNPLNPNRPDLFVLGMASPNPAGRFDEVSFPASLHNGGASGANTVTVDFFANLPAQITAFVPPAGFSCQLSPGAGMLLRCVGSIGPFTSVTFPIRARLANPSSVLAGTPFSVFGYIDTQRTVNELDENNNSFTIATVIR